MNNLNIKIKLKSAFFATFLTALTFLLLFLYIGIYQRKYNEEISKTLAREKSREATIATEQHFSSALMVTKAMVLQALLYQQLGVDRQKIVEMMEKAINENESFLGVWTMWEPNSYDGKDKFYKTNPVYDTLGQLNVTFFRHGGKIRLEDTRPDDYSKDFYTIPKQLKTELILEPYFYIYSGYPVNFYESSIITPIIINNEFKGVFAIDIDLESLKKNLREIHLYKTGFVSLVSNNGIIISHNDTTLICKSVPSVVNFLDSIRNIKSQTEYVQETRSESTGQKIIRFYYPISIGQMKNPWFIVVEIPVAEIAEQSRQLFLVALVTLIIGLSLILYLIINISDRRRYEKIILQSYNKLEESHKILAESEQKYRNLFENSLTGIYRTTPDGRVQIANPAIVKMLGYESFDEIAKINLETDKLLSKSSREDFKKLIEQQGFVVNYETQWLTNTGQVIDIVENARAYYDQDGKVMYYEGFVLDVTARKQAEMKLLESEERYRTIIEAFPDIIVISDLDGNFLYANKVLEQITGITPADYNNPDRKARIHPDDLPLVRNAIIDILKSTKKHTAIIENRFIDVWGKTHWFSGIISKIFYQGHLCLQTITRDITEKKIIENELEQYRNHLETLVKERTEELATANQRYIEINKELLIKQTELQTTLNNLKKAQENLIQAEKMASLGMLSAGVAHEINNPVNYIYNGLLAIENHVNELPDEFKNRVKPFFEAVFTGIDRITSIVKSLGRYSSSEKMIFTPCDVHQIIDDSLTILFNQYKNRIEIQKYYQATTPVIMANEGQLHQVFLNILHNAVQAIEKNGTIIIETKNINRSVEVSITDTGCGIDENNLKYIFDPFFTTKEPGKGTGLGLSITKTIITEHKGTIHCLSNINKGTQFVILLPVKS